MSQFGGFLAGFLFVTCECVGAHLVRENPAVQTLDPYEKVFREKLPAPVILTQHCSDHVFDFIVGWF